MQANNFLKWFKLIQEIQKLIQIIKYLILELTGEL